MDNSAILPLPPLTLSRYRFTLSADDPMLLPPYKGSTLRGGFGHAFKRMVCFQPEVRTCSECLLRNTCPYAYVFETPVPPESEVLRKNQHVPHPLVIQAPPEETTTYFPGDNLDFHVVLVGRAQQYLPYFLVAFQELGRQGLGRFLELPGGRRRGRYHLAQVEAVSALDDKRALVYTAAQPTHIHAQALPVETAQITAYAQTLPNDRLTIIFHTPARLQHQTQLVRQGPPFAALLKALLGRVSSLAYFHCDTRWELDFRGWIDRAEAVELVESRTVWVDWERYSGRQQQHISMGGLVGQATYAGDLAPFLPLLVLGTLVHVGKGTVFGNGRFSVADSVL